ncbi:MAG: MerR family transcriptional regulator [Anaerolineae bacterium]|nr:MerR family transcriptional regulator [Anaerolineae bacterium]
MFKIDEFSKFSQVPTKTLRYYDEIGLLKPAEVDLFTGYRYYSASQLPRLHRILAMKNLGLSLDQIGQLLEEDLSVDQIRGILRLKQSEIRQQVQEEQARLARVEWRLKQIEQEEAMPTQDVIIKKLVPQTVISVRDTLPIQGIQQLFGEVFGYLGQHKMAPAGPPIGIYYNPEFSEDAVDVEIAVPVSGTIAGSGRVKCWELPAVEQAACIIHQGGYETIGGTYGQLMTWIEANGYRITGPTCEVYLQGPESGDPSRYVTEIRFPVEKA